MTNTLTDSNNGVCARCGKPILSDDEQLWGPPPVHADCAPQDQPGDGLPPSEPTQDIGEWPLATEAPDEMLPIAPSLKEVFLRKLSALSRAERDYAVYDSRWWGGEANGAAFVASCLHDEIVSLYASAEVERDALAAQLARVQAVIDGLPSEPRTMSCFLNEADCAGYMARYAVRQQLEAARKGEAK